MDRFWSLLEKRRLVAGFASLLFLSILLLSISSMLAVRATGRQAAEFFQTELLGISHIKEANIHLIATGRALRQMVLAPTFVDRDHARAQLDQAMLDLETEMAAVRANIVRDHERLVLNEFEQEFGNYRRNVGAAIALIDGSADYQEKASAYITGEPFNEVGDAADRLLHRMAAIKEEDARATALAMARDSRTTQWLALALLLSCLLFGATAAVSVGRSIRQPVHRLRHAIENLPEDGVDASDEGGAVIAPAHGAEIRGEESAREQFEPLDGPHIVPPRYASILVVEDSGSNQEVIAGLRANAGCRVTIASSGPEALALLEKSPHDIVLINMQMPMVDGINATLEIRKNPAFDRLPIIALTTRGIHQDSERCLAAGMDGHIAKPIDPAELFRALMCWVTPDTSSTQPREHRNGESPAGSIACSS